MAGEMVVYSYSVQNAGTERTLGQYSHNTIGSNSCSHNDDVIVSVLKVSDSAHVYIVTLSC